MLPAEFEERSYEAPLYNQLERGVTNVFTPGQVLENRVGFDRGLFIAELALWETLGYSAPPMGAALSLYQWPWHWGPPEPRRQLPNFRLNLFLQVKRPVYYTRGPRATRKIGKVTPPLWSFRTSSKQQRQLEKLAAKVGRRAHVAYAAPAFHTKEDLFRHTKSRTVVQNSTFPTVKALSSDQR